MTEGTLRAEATERLPREAQMAALKALAQERAWPGDVLAGVWVRQAELLEEATEEPRSEALQEAVYLLTEARDLATLHTLKAQAQERLNRIRQAELTLGDVPRVVPPGEPLQLTVRHRNVRGATVCFHGVSSLEPQRLTLTKTEPYIWGESVVTLPALPPGKVKLAFVLEGNFAGQPKTERTHELHACTFTVAAVGQQVHPTPSGNGWEESFAHAYLVADVRTGVPLPGAKVTLAERSRKNPGEASVVWSATTDALGLAHIPKAAKPKKGTSSSEMLRTLTVEARGETLALSGDIGQRVTGRAAREATPSLRLFTDRTLYRPGETVRYQLVLLRQEDEGMLHPQPKAEGMLTLEGQTATGTRKLLSQRVTFSERGSHAGDLTLPKDFVGSLAFRLKMGKTTLHGGAVSVSEYKAPGFVVTLEREKRGTPVTEPIHYKGTAIDLSGVPLVGAAVTWRVQSGEDAVRGVATVGTDGTFAFAAQLPSTEENRWVTSTAQVLGANGERQDAGTADFVPRWGYEFSCETPTWLLAGEPFDVRLEAERAVAGTLTATHGTNTVARADFAKPGTVRLTLPAGDYDLTAAAGPVTNHVGRVTVLPRDGRLGDAFEPSTEALVRVRQEAPFTLGQPVEVFAGIRGEGPAFLMVSTRQGVGRILPLTSPFLSLTVEEGLREDFALTVYGFDKGRFRSATETFRVKPPEALKVEAVRFAPTARPGSVQTWEIAVDDPAAELIVTCYDKALDALGGERTWEPFAPPYRYWSIWNLAQALLNPTALWMREPLPQDFCTDGNLRNRDTMVCEAAFDGGNILGDVKAAPRLKKNVMETREAPSDEAVAGHGDASAGTLPPPRTNFAHTAFWAAQKRLEGGRAVFTFTLPDSLTTWRLMAFAYTPDGRSGTLVRDCVARLDVMLKPYLPRTLRVGDRLTLEVLLTNVTDRPLTTWAELNRANRRPVTLPAKGSTTVSWEVVAQAVPGRQTFEFATEGDAVRMELPVLDDRVTVEDVYPVTLVDTRPVTVDIAEPAPLLDLSHRWDPTPSAAVAEALKALLASPEEGCDDAFARFGALALLRRMGAAPKGADVREEALLDRLLAQRTQGLWSWFPGGRGDPCVSAEICVGVARLHRLGLAPKPLMEAVRETLTRQAKALPFAAWAYARAAFTQEWPLENDLTDRLFRAYREAGSVQERRMLTLAAHRLGAHKVAEAGLKDVLDAMNTSKTWGAWWPQERTWWNRWHTPLESHALGLEVLQAFGRKAEAKAAAQWLLQHRRLNDWGTSRATLAAAFALGAEPDGGKAPPAATPGVRVTSRRTDGGARREVTLARTAPGLSFGRLVATYRLPLAQVPPPLVGKAPALSLTRTLTPANPKVGDTVTVTLTLTAAQPMGHVRVRDERPANTEPVRVLPWWDFGVGGYVRPDDTGTELFLSELPRGVTAFRYELKVTHAGQCLPGLATAAPVVAPDFAARTDAQPFEASGRR